MQGDNGQGYVCRSGTLRCFYMDRSIVELPLFTAGDHGRSLFMLWHIPPIIRYLTADRWLRFFICNTIGGMEYDPNKSKEFT